MRQTPIYSPPITSQRAPLKLPRLDLSHHEATCNNLIDLEDIETHSIELEFAWIKPKLNVYVQQGTIDP